MSITTATEKKLKIGIALGGGGAKGFAHIGVLEVLTEAGIDCQIVTGTSAGALVGAAYACGKLDVLKDVSKNISLKNIPRMLSPSWSLQGLFNGKNALDLLETAIPTKTIQELNKVFGAVAVDLLKSEVVEFTVGDLRTILRASISIPGLFTPVSLDGQVLVDGGIIEVLPVQLNRKLGADFIIAVDLYSSIEEPPVALTSSSGIKNALTYVSKRFFPESSSKINLINVLESTFATIQRTSTKQRLKEYPAEVIICPAVSRIGVLDFHRAAPVIEIGRIAGLKALPEIKRLLALRQGS